MLKKIVSIKNVGRFRNSACQGNPELSRYTVIVGANGLGKSTCCAILRSLKTGDPADILGRRTLGVEDVPSVHLRLRDGDARFNGKAWSTGVPILSIFDGVFIAENVHSGELVEIDHRRNLYRVIIGEQGVHLAEEEATLAAKGRQLASAMTTAARAIQQHVPEGMTLDTFVGLLVNPAIDDAIADQERTVEAVQRARQINERPSLLELPIPEPSDALVRLLASTIDDITSDAEARLSEHLALHAMKEGGSSWIAKGLEHARSGACPFCGQDIRGLPLISAYRAVFSDGYRELQSRITAVRSEVEESFGEGALGRLLTQAEQNKGAAEFWQRYCTFDLSRVGLPEGVCDAARTYKMAALALLDRKTQTLLESVELDETFNAAVVAYESFQARIKWVTAAIRDVNSLIAAKKKETGAADVKVSEAALARLRAVKVRHSEPVSRLCTDYHKLKKEKKCVDGRKAKTRERLDAHTSNVIRPYEQQINQYLESFNAGFKITQTKHHYLGGAAASSYQLVVNNIPVDLGNGRTSPDQPSFKNTLSSGDRTTLALAFFLAHLERDQDSANRIVVFDDPFNSQDAFRRRQTVHEIIKIARKCAQVIVLSHDAIFAKQVWDKAPAAERIALHLADHRALGSKIVPLDLEQACKGRTTADIDDLQTYVTSGAGKLLDLVRKMRGVLETYCWTTYPTSFRTGEDWLGEIARKIREGGDQHPAAGIYDPIDRINDYISQYYHGEDMTDTTPDQIDPQELTGFVRLTLTVVNALQA